MKNSSILQTEKSAYWKIVCDLFLCMNTGQWVMKWGNTGVCDDVVLEKHVDITMNREENTMRYWKLKTLRIVWEVLPPVP